MPQARGLPSSRDDLRDRVALVTGAAGAIGRAVCVSLAEAGAIVVAADVDEDGGRRTAGESGGHFVACDVTDLEANRAAVAFAMDTGGRLDLVHLNAGVTTGCGIDEDFDLDRYRRAVAVNLDGVVLGAHAALPALRASGGGAIVATSSLAGLTGTPWDPVYSATKHGVVGLVRSLGPYVEAQGGRCNAVCPGYAESAMTVDIREAIEAQGLELLTAQEVADAALDAFLTDVSGACWFVQPGRPAEPFTFRNVPGPRPTSRTSP
ncbi:MAG TPA: SDR family NAD(P)-dependent oxidoreductase, partial [Solirubrobacteraceae bacterium]|nr:SDR family NAD(P)-dependent oxidoreductase [Solirubrobacteraceae bacterium]